VLVADAVDERTDVEVAAVRLLTSDDRPAPAAAGERVRAMLEARPRPPIAVETFGGLTVRRGPRTLGDADYGRPKARALLAALVCGGRTGLTRDMLLDAFWPDLPPDRGVKAFDTTLHALRRALDPWSSPRSGASVIARQGDVYRLDLGPEDSLDVAEVERLAGDAQTVLDEPALARLTRAEEITAREFLPDFRYEDWTQVVRASLQRTRVRVLERLAEALLASGRPRAAIERYRRLVDLEPETERWHRELMRAYQAAGERGMALRQFHACRTALRASLGAEPSEETRALYRSLL
jgi:DNA-binding SARP family transcriptional activator